MSPLSVFLDEYSQKFINFVCLFKEPGLSFIDLFYCFYYLFLLQSLLFPSFCWLLGFVLFPVPLGVRLDYLFENVIISWGSPVSLLTSLLERILPSPVEFGVFCFHFVLSQKYFLISNLISSLTHWFFSCMLFGL